NHHLRHVPPRVPAGLPRQARSPRPGAHGHARWRRRTDLMANTIATAARGAAMVATEVGRAGLDRLVPGGRAVPRRADQVTPAWLRPAPRPPARGHNPR